MQFHNPFKKEPAPEAASQQRIEPQIGQGAQDSPWDVKAQEGDVPAFDVVAADEPAAPEEPVAPTFSAVSAGEPAGEVPPPALDAEGDAPAPEKRPVPVAEAASAAAAGTAAAAAAPAVTTEGRHRFMRFGEKKADPEDNMPTEEELLARQRTRHRMMGLAALLMTAVAVCPFLLDREEAMPEAQVSTDIPPVAERAVTSLEPARPETTGDVKVAGSSTQNESTGSANLKNEAGKGKAVTPADSRQDIKAVTKTEPAGKVADTKKPETKPAAKPEAKPAAKTDTKPAAAAKAPAGKGFYVQLIATSSEKKADQMVAQLKKAGYSAWKAETNVKAGKVWCVRAGLYKSAGEAEGVAAKLLLNGYPQGKVVSQ